MEKQESVRQEPAFETWWASREKARQGDPSVRPAKELAHEAWEEVLKRASHIIASYPQVDTWIKNEMVHNPKHGIIKLHSCLQCK